MPVNGALPLLGRHAAMGGDLHVGVVFEPPLQLVLVGLARRRDALAVGRGPVLVDARHPPVPVRPPFFGSVAAHAIEAVPVEVALGKARVARAPAGVAALDVAPPAERIEHFGGRPVLVANDTEARQHGREMLDVEMPRLLTVPFLLGAPLITRVGVELDHPQLGVVIFGHCSPSW